MSSLPQISYNMLCKLLRDFSLETSGEHDLTERSGEIMAHIQPIFTIPAEFLPQYTGTIRGDWELRGDGSDYRFVVTHRGSSNCYLLTLDAEDWRDVDDLLTLFLSSPLDGTPENEERA